MIDNNITTLPVDAIGIARASGIKVLKNSAVGLLTGNESGACFYNYDIDKWYMVYDDEATEGRRRVAIAHELGHIFLGHELTASKYGRTHGARKPKAEEQADAFAARLLAPACVLWGLNLRSAEEIEAACNVSVAVAKRRAERMKVLYARGKFLASSLERMLYMQFEQFINENKENPSI